MKKVLTRSTGQYIEKRTGRPVTLVLSGPLGGDQQISALVASGEVDAVIFCATRSPHIRTNRMFLLCCGSVTCIMFRLLPILPPRKQCYI